MLVCQEAFATSVRGARVCLRGVRRVRGAGGPCVGRPRGRLRGRGCGGRRSRGPGPRSARGSSSTQPRAARAGACLSPCRTATPTTVPGASRTGTSKTHLPRSHREQILAGDRPRGETATPGCTITPVNRETVDFYELVERALEGLPPEVAAVPGDAGVVVGEGSGAR